MFKFNDKLSQSTPPGRNILFHGGRELQLSTICRQLKSILILGSDFHLNSIFARILTIRNTPIASTTHFVKRSPDLF